MNVQNLYNLVRPLWPDNIDISDGKLLENSGFMSLNMSNVYQKIEDSIDFEVEHWKNLGAWSFEQAVWKHAKECFENGVYVIELSNISLESFDFQVKSNLCEESWESERGQYLGLV
jgi:hypothetical protein